MRKFNIFCSLIIVFTMTLAIITLGQNIAVRTTGAYTFYFNDTRVVDIVFNEYTNSEVSDQISGFMNSWRPDKFQIYEDTGYDLEGIFDGKDSHNMLAFKKAADISLVLCIVSLIITVAIYVHFLKNDFKMVLRKRIKVTGGLVALLLAAEVFLLKTKTGIGFLMSVGGLEKLAETSALKTLLGGEFLSMAGNFLLGYTLIAYFVTLYVTLVLTKPPRIFF